jgi:UDP-N-acetylmuramoyl-L-alanyl-D-glutamate--2,6-diaminopimelate ligase
VPDRPSLRPQQVSPHPLSEVAEVIGTGAPSGGTNVTGITHDSRQVCAGDLYVALPGANTHGARFAAQAEAAGAAAIWTDPAGVEEIASADHPAQLPVIVSAAPRTQLGEVAARIYGEPARELLMLGITGTNGKTTTSYLIEAGLQAAGHQTGMVGTVETRVAGRMVPSVRTTPEATDVHALLAVMRERGVTACVMEVSSHALVFGRVDGIVFDVAGFTNLSQDHLDFHTDLEDYFAAKASLFTPERARRGVVCVDDTYGLRLAAEAGVPVVTVASVAASATNDTAPTSLLPATDDTSATDHAAADWQVTDREVARSGATTRADLRHLTGRSISVGSPIPGEFNLANAVLAVVMLMEAGVEAQDALRGVATCPGVPGRMERVQSTRIDEPLAVVDYAHTPDAVANILRALRPSTNGRLIIVLGAGGDRDRAKRPLMGAVAAREADVVIVTDDNPRSEEPAAIRAAVRQGAESETDGHRAEVREIGDRGEAIAAAVDMSSGPADTVVVAGKGHEQGQEIAGVVNPFDDRLVLRQALERRGTSGGPSATGGLERRGTERGTSGGPSATGGLGDDRRDPEVPS